jgi:hypothetical protein
MIKIILISFSLCVFFSWLETEFNLNHFVEFGISRVKQNVTSSRRKNKQNTNGFGRGKVVDR